MHAPSHPQSTTEAVATFPEIANRYRVRQSTVVRWAKRGVKSANGLVRLHAYRIGGLWRTTWRDVQEFIQATNSACEETSPLPRSPAQRRRAVALAEKQFDALAS
jgi:hypothetical protein